MNNLMNNLAKEEIEISNPMAFILYQQRVNRQKDECYYNEEALEIISFAVDCGRKTEVSSSRYYHALLKMDKTA